MSWLTYFPQLQQAPDSGDWLDILLAGKSQASLLDRLASVTVLQPVTVTETLTDTMPAVVLEAEDKRLIQAFAFLITQHKKSTPRMQAMLDLHARVQQEDVAEMILSYCLQWESAEQVWERGEAFLLQHPESLGLRLPLALLACGQQQPDRIAALLANCMSWSDFQRCHSQLSATAQNLRLFHTISCLYFARRQELLPAVWAWLICREAQAALAERQTLSREIVRFCQAPESLAQLQHGLQGAL